MSEFLQATSIQSDDTLRLEMSRALGREDKVELMRLIQQEYPANIAEIINSMAFNDVLFIFKAILVSDIDFCAEMIPDLEFGIISQLYPYLSHQEWIWIFKELSDDDVAAILELFPEEASRELLSRLPRSDKADILELMNYPEDSAGRIMTNEFLAIDGKKTVTAAIEEIRSVRDFDPMNLFFVYVTDNNRLVGMVSLRQLLLANKATPLKEIMRTDVVAVDVESDQEDVAELVRRHDEVSVPVVDDSGEVLGIITVDDVIDVIDEESEEDLYKIIGTSDEELMVAGNTRKIVALRLPWILASFFGSLMVALVLKYSESDLFGPDAGKIFVFVPMICAMGGNVGVQSATIMARLLSTSSPDWDEAKRATLKEARVGFSLGIICGCLIGGVAWYWGGIAMLVTVMAAMISAMTTAATTGTIIPVIMKKLGFDPALATGPFVTSFNDLVATIVYFAIAFVCMQEMSL